MGAAETQLETERQVELEQQLAALVQRELSRFQSRQPQTGIL